MPSLPGLAGQHGVSWRVYAASGEYPVGFYTQLKGSLEHLPPLIDNQERPTAPRPLVGARGAGVLGAAGEVLDDGEHRRAGARVPDLPGVEDDQRRILGNRRRAVGQVGACSVGDVVVQPLGELGQVAGQVDVAVLARFGGAAVELLLEEGLAGLFARELAAAVHGADGQ
jgi:hypothetical protein